MISANKLYKESKSQLSFKDWLKETQQKGILQDHEKMYNLIESEGEGDDEEAGDEGEQDGEEGDEGEDY